MWKIITIDDVRLYLAEDEITKLQEYSLNENFEDVVQKTIIMVSDMFRGAWIAKGYNIDNREHYICTTYLPFILAYIRFVLWNRFPNAGEYALTETRLKEYEKATELLKDPIIGLTPPEDGDPSSVKDDAAIALPYLRFDDPYFGFAYNFEKKFKFVK
jgi:hypothetical protein